MADKRKIQLEPEVNAAAVRPGVDATKQALLEIGQAGQQAGQQAADGLGKVGEGGKKAADKVERDTQSLIGSVQRATAAFKAGQKGSADYFEELGRQRGVSGDALKPYIDGLRAAEAAQKSATKSLGVMQVSAAQTSAALRQLPAQFTDIVTSLQGGQAPLTVLLQQGGQIKDSFGGAGAAAKALGGYVGGLVSPFTLAAGAAAVLAYGYLTGAAQSEALRKSVILTGTAAGASASQLGDMAARIGQVAGSQARASETLAAFVQNTSAGADQLERLSRVALQFERAGGDAVANTVKAFAELDKDPLNAIQKLDEHTHFLTASVYAQIKALKDQGKETEAAAAAQAAYASALEDRTPKLAQNLGLLARLWRDVRDATANAVDAAQSVGRDSTINEQIKAAQSSLNFSKSRATPAAGGGYLDIAIANYYANQAKSLETVLAKLKESKAQTEALAKLEGERQETEQARVKWLSEGDKFLTRQQQAEREIAVIRNQGAKAGADQAEIDRRVAATRAKFADQGGDNELATLRARIKETNEYITALGQRGAATRDLNEGEKTALKLQEQLGNTLSVTVRAEKERALALAVTLGQRQRLADGLKADIELAAKAADQTGQQADAIRQRAAEQRAANEVYGQGRTAIELLTLAQLKKQAADLEATNSTDPAYLANLHAKIEAQKEFVAELKAADFKTLNQGAEEWLRTATEGFNLQAAEPAMLAASAAERQLITANRETDLKLAKALAEVERSSLSDAEKAALASKDRAAADKERARNAAAASQAALREVDDFLDPSRAESFGSALSKAFEGAGNSLAKMSNALSDFAASQKAVTRELAVAGKIDDPAKRAAAQLKLNEKSQLNQIGLYASMAGAAKGFFSEGTRGYKALEAAETAFRLVQLASDLQKGLSAAAVGIANQAQGDPYTAFPRMAVMAAAMAALGFAVAFSGNGGGRTGGDGRPQATGTGTVLGDSSAKSESISKSIEALSSTAKLQLSTQGGMLAALRNIESSIGGLSNLIVRTGAGDLTSGASFGVNTSTSAPLASLLSGGANLLTNFLPSLIGDKLTNALFGNRTKVTGTGLNVPTQSLADAINNSQLQQYVDTYSSKKFLGITYSSSSGSQYSAADAQLSQQFTQIFRNLYDGVSQAAGPLGLALDQVKSRLDGFVLSIGKIDLQGLTGTQIQEKLTAVIGAAADGIAQAAIPGLQDFEKVGEGYFETLVRVASGVEQAKADLANLGIAAIAFGDITRKQGDVAAELVRQSIAAFESADGTLSSVGVLINNLDAGADDLASTYKSLVSVRDVLIAVGASGDSLTASLIQGAGGLDNLASSLGNYLQGPFFTDQERAAAAAASLAEQFSRIGVNAVPQSYAAFRQLVQGIDRSTDAGQRLYGQVLGLAGAFQSAQEAADKATGTVASRLPDILKSQAADRASLEVDLLKAQGNAAGAAALKRQQDLAALTAGLTDAEAALATAGYDLLANLRAQIDAATSAAQAAAAEVQRVAAVASQRDSLQAQIDRALGDTAAIRARELAALDPSNRALQERLYKIQDEQAAQELAAQAAQQAQQAAEEAAQAAEQLRQAWQSVTDTIYDEVKRIRGLNGANATKSLSEAKADFAITTAQARAGDQAAAKLLPALSQALDSLAESQLSSAAELRLLRAQTAASLKATADQLAGRYGLAVPRLATGTNEVPADMLAVVHKGEAIVPRAFNPAVNGGARDERLLAALNGLREDQRTQASTLVRVQSDLLKLHKLWNQQGLPSTRLEEVAP